MRSRVLDANEEPTPPNPVRVEWCPTAGDVPRQSRLNNVANALYLAAVTRLRIRMAEGGWLKVWHERAEESVLLAQAVEGGLRLELPTTTKEVTVTLVWGNAPGRKIRCRKTIKRRRRSIA